MTPVTTPALARPGTAITRPIENICASQGELKIHLKSGFLFKLAEAVPMADYDRNVLGLRLLTPSKRVVATSALVRPVRRKAEWLAGAELCTITNSKMAGYLTKMQAW
ncbi:hypothetical protein GCM10008931_06390 [Oceanobacillus oncorhynchi subsp. oncorhynchi]